MNFVFPSPSGSSVFAVNVAVAKKTSPAPFENCHTSGSIQNPRNVTSLQHPTSPISIVPILTTLLLWFAMLTGANAQKVALVVGNNAYTHASPLSSPVKDALDMGAVLESNGYSTLKLTDANRSRMIDGLDEMQQVGANADICLFYFSGHGLEYQGANYLSPINSRLRTRDDLETSLVPLERVLEALGNTKARRKIIVLDCCRSDPTNPSAGGLAAVERGLIPRGTLVVYAGAPGHTVPDGGRGRNSPYTLELLRQMTPGRDAISLFSSVAASRFRSQDPWICFDGSTEGLRNLANYDMLGGQASRPAPTWTTSQTNTTVRPKPVAAEQNPLKISSYWDHNGSTMGLLVRGKQRFLIYIKVREGLRGLVEPGMVLFDGVSEGNRYKGRARRFSKGLKPVEYAVEGPILGGGNKVVLEGRAPIRNPDGTVRKVINDRLEFSYLSLGK